MFKAVPFSVPFTAMHIAMPTIELSQNTCFSLVIFDITNYIFICYLWEKLSQPCTLFGINTMRSASEARGSLSPCHTQLCPQPKAIAGVCVWVPQILLAHTIEKQKVVNKNLPYIAI